MLFITWNEPLVIDTIVDGRDPAGHRSVTTKRILNPRLRRFIFDQLTNDIEAICIVVTEDELFKHGGKIQHERAVGGRAIDISYDMRLGEVYVSSERFITNCGDDDKNKSIKQALDFALESCLGKEADKC